LWRESFFHVLGIKRIIFALDAWTFFKVRFDPVVLNSLANGGSVIGAILGVATLFAATTSDFFEPRRFRSRVRSEFVAAPGISL
jgi:uncharacterized membrane protein YqgA involved in biofilm formation